MGGRELRVQRIYTYVKYEEIETTMLGIRRNNRPEYVGGLAWSVGGWLVVVCFEGKGVEVQVVPLSRVEWRYIYISWNLYRTHIGLVCECLLVLTRCLLLSSV